MSMRDQFWDSLVEMGHKIKYFESYAISTRRISNMWSGALLIASAGSIATWEMWGKYPIVWAALIMAAQVLQVLRPLSQASKQNEALKFITHDWNLIFDEMIAFWNFIDDKTDSEIDQSLSCHMERKRTALNRFAANIDFPEKRRCIKKATANNSQYFWYHYGTRIEEVF